MSYKSKTIDSTIKIDSIKNRNEDISVDFLNTGDDKGLVLTGGQLSVGTVSDPRESVFGSGDSYPCDIAFKYDLSDETGTTIVNAANVTDILRSDTGSSTALFDLGDANKIMLFGADDIYWGLKIKYDSLGSLSTTPENIVGEYLMTSAVWTPYNYMATNADYPHTQFGWRVASSTNEHLFLGFDAIDPLSTPWMKQDLIINGVIYNKYWFRLRSTAPIAVSPVIEQVKHHTNRTEINATGVIELFGLARSPFTLQEGIRGTIPNTDSNPPNEPVRYATEIRAGYVDNEFVGTARDSFIITQNILNGLDTSIPLTVVLSYFVNNNNSGDVEISASYVQVEDGFLYQQNVPPDGRVVGVDPISSSSQNIRRTLLLEVPINEIGEAGGGVVISIERDARASNPNDTYNGNVIFTNIVLRGYRWRI